jgi:hypothetical protein
VTNCLKVHVMIPFRYVKALKDMVGEDEFKVALQKAREKYKNRKIRNDLYEDVTRLRN